MKSNPRLIVEEFQQLYCPKKEERNYKYKLTSVGEATGIKSIVEKDGVCYITCGIMVMVMNHAGSEILKITSMPVPMQYSAKKASTVSRRRRKRPGEVLEQIYSDVTHFYRKPDFDFACRCIIENYGVAADSKFEFSEGSYRRDGVYYNRVIRIDIKLSEVGERIFHINEFLADNN